MRDMINVVLLMGEVIKKGQLYFNHNGRSCINIVLTHRKLFGGKIWYSQFSVSIWNKGATIADKILRIGDIIFIRGILSMNRYKGSVFYNIHTSDFYVIGHRSRDNEEN